jgi:hypothetical protein
MSDINSPGLADLQRLYYGGDTDAEYAFLQAAAEAGVTAADVLEVASGSGTITAVDDQRLVLVAAGALRNDGSPNYWQPIEDAQHASVNIASVTTEAAGTITINLTDARPGKAVVAVALGDETLAQEGFIIGSSYGDTSIVLKFSRQQVIADYISYNGSAWVSQDGIITPGAFSGGELSLSHEDVGNGYAASIVGRGASTLVLASTGSNAVTATGTKVMFRDYAGALITSPSTDMKFYISRTRSMKNPINPETVDTTAFPNSNIWFEAWALAG